MIVVAAAVLIGCGHHTTVTGPVAICDLPLPPVPWCAPIQACVGFTGAGTATRAWYQVPDGSMAWPCDGADCSAAAAWAVAWTCGMPE